MVMRNVQLEQCVAGGFSIHFVLFGRGNGNGSGGKIVILVTRLFGIVERNGRGLERRRFK